MSDWLVPVSRHLRFAQAGGRTVEGSFRALQAAATGGRLAKVECDLRGPLVDLEPGDQLWFYAEELEAGVFAVGRARKPSAAKRPSVTVTLDRTLTRLFAADPLPAAVIRRWVPELRQGAVALDLRPRALAVLQGWQDERNDRDAELLTPLGAVPWRVATRGAGASLARDEVVGPIARLLRSQDFAVGIVPATGRAGHWVVARRVRDVVVIDVERPTKGRGRAEALAAIGPLREYRWRLEREPRGGDLRVRTSLWISFTGRPHADVTTFLEDEDILVSWLRAGAVELTDRSKQRWYQYLGVR